MSSPYSRVALVDQLRGSATCARAALVHEHGHVRMRADDRSGGARMIEVDVRQQNVTDVIPPDPVLLETELECGKTCRRPGIHDRHAGSDCTMPLAIACRRPRNSRSIYDKPCDKTGIGGPIILVGLIRKCPLTTLRLCSPR